MAHEARSSTVFLVPHVLQARFVRICPAITHTHSLSAAAATALATAINGTAVTTTYSAANCSAIVHDNFWVYGKKERGKLVVAIKFLVDA